MRIVISTHGKFGEGILNSLNMLMGEQKNIDVITFNEVMGIDELKEKVSEYLSNYEDDILVLTDLKGGTPFNVFSILTHGRENVKILYGLNLPTLIEAASLSEIMNLEEIVSSVEDMMIETIGFSNL